MAAEVLIIDDDTRLSAMVAEYLGKSGFDARTAVTGAEGLSQIEQKKPDAVILDIMLPDTDGFEVCRKIRLSSDVPVIMLTAKGEETDRIVGLELGADDYLPKPFNPRELLARLKAILRRASNTSQAETVSVLKFGELVIDPDSRLVSVGGEPKSLTAYQFDMLCAFAEHPGRVLSRDQLMDLLKGKELDVFDRSIDVHISRIRAAIEKDPKHPRRIITVRGAGYVFARNQNDI
ncbi:response regulator [Rhizobium sp. L1K21]|uniref:response regulator n=1 Tax=Rhizobium sp. L1K21 TaxID=2954933 RepID=UPI002093AB98|nr:response regulator transcription factor [Rhizobium sp. L1K21]MCO6186129.1 response regulator transcription factor [Rhizobium sp. L1K21]